MSQPSVIYGLQKWMKSPQTVPSPHPVVIAEEWDVGVGGWAGPEAAHLPHLPLLKVNKEIGFGPR